MNSHPIWEIIRELKVVCKVKKIFIWIIIEDTLPWRITLARRHVKVSGQCFEFGRYLLFKFPRAKSVWKYHRLDTKIAEVVLEFLLCNEQEITLILSKQVPVEIYATMCWHLWLKRIHAIKGENVMPTSKSLICISALITNFFVANSPKAKPNNLGWTRPPPESLIIKNKIMTIIGTKKCSTWGIKHIYMGI
jgi:hypothetical protein